jgi:hypothetical protein
MRDILQWTAPAPLWPEAAAGASVAARRDSLSRPAILRFASDDFMDDFLALMGNDPARLGDYLARPETWRGPTPAVAPVQNVPKFLQPLTRLRLAAERKQRQLTGGQGLEPVNSGLPAALNTGAPLKLYQPGHQRFYLVTSGLVCARVGLPDHAVNPARQEKVGFVVRRLMPPGAVDPGAPLPAPGASWEEHALVTDGSGRGWRKVAASGGRADMLLAGEDQLPLFGTNFTGEDGRRRRVWAGLIPTGKRESYMGAAALPPAGGGASQGGAAAAVDPRMMPLWLQVTEPWKRLIEKSDAARAMQASPKSPLSTDEPLPGDAQVASTKTLREQIQTISWYILLDFTKYLAEHLPAVWQVVKGQQPESTLTNKPKELAVYNALKTTTLPGSVITALTSPTVYTNPAKVAPALYKAANVSANLRDALRAVTTFDANPNAEERLESVAGSYDRDKPSPTNATKPDPAWPTFLFPLADPSLAATAGPLPSVTIPTIAGEKAAQTAGRKVDKLSDLIEAALPAQAPPPQSQLPLAAQSALDMRAGWFVLRCVYERPECGPIDPPVVSAPTAPFQMAGFFDPDAPARPVRIALPIDTSPAGLRKFDKNTAFMISDMLCGQIERVKGMTLGDLIRSVLPWPLHKDLSVPDGGPCKSGGGLEVGMICSLSIPIITICALLLLFIIVFLLDIIFRWAPFFFICFPLPGLSARKKS